MEGDSNFFKKKSECSENVYMKSMSSQQNKIYFGEVKHVGSGDPS